MTASAVEICSRKKRKANRSSEFGNDTVGILYKTRTEKSGVMRMSRNKWLRHGEQINRNFGIKSFLSQNWGACVYTKIWEEECGNSKLPRWCHQGIGCIRIDTSWFRCGTRIGSLPMTSTDNVNKLRLASGETCRTLQKGKYQGPSYIKLGMFSLIPKIVMSRT